MIGWENNQGAYFINKLDERVGNLETKQEDTESDIEDINDEITDMSELKSLVNEKQASSSVEYTCNWEDYAFLLFCPTYYSNINESVLIPNHVFNSTSVGSAINIKDTTRNIA